MSFNVEDYYTYIKERNTFPVSFLNTNQLSIGEVSDIFKEYGDLKVIQSKSPTGYCFVNFFSQESAVNCILSMKNHDKIKLCRPNKRDPLPKSDLNKEKKNKNNNDNKVIKSGSISDRLIIRSENEKCDNEKSLVTDKSSSSTSSPSPPIIHQNEIIKKKNLTQTVDNLPKKIIEQQKNLVESNDDEIVDKSSEKKHMIEKNKEEEEKKNNQIKDKQIIETNDLKLDAYSISNLSQDLSQTTVTAMNTSETSSSNSELLEKIEQDILVPYGVSSTTNHHKFFDNDDDVFYTEQNYLSVKNFNITDKPMQIIEAQDIVIAGIPEELGTIGILHYLEKFNPILISNIKISYIKPSVRYCYVYFSTLQDAENAEIYLDDKLFGTSRIIALRPDSLAQQILKVA